MKAKTQKLNFSAKLKLNLLRKKDPELDRLLKKTEVFVKNGGIAQEAIMDYGHLAVHMLEKYDTDITSHTDKIVAEIVTSAKKQQVLNCWK